MGKVHAEFMDPNAVMALVSKLEVNQLVDEVHVKLEQVMQQL